MPSWYQDGETDRACDRAGQLPRPAHLPLLGAFVAHRSRQAPRASPVGLRGHLSRHHGGCALWDLPAKQKGEQCLSPFSGIKVMLFDSSRNDPRPTSRDWRLLCTGASLRASSGTAAAVPSHPTIPHTIQNPPDQMQMKTDPSSLPNRSRPGSSRSSASRNDSTRSTCSGCSTTASSCSWSTVPSPSTWCLLPQPWRASAQRDR